jgi:hypothetical protein
MTARDHDIGGTAKISANSRQNDWRGQHMYQDRDAVRRTMYRNR